jgi:hypothetical protein
MQGTGMLVLEWPIVLGCDASGIVVELGEGVSKFKVGDKIFGCTRLGHAGYGTFQEFVSKFKPQKMEPRGRSCYCWCWGFGKFFREEGEIELLMR